MKYFRVFESEEEYIAYSMSEDKITPNVSTLRDSSKTWINVKTHEHDNGYLTFRALESGTFQLSLNNVEYSLDNGATWTELSAGNSTPTVNSGDTILWKSMKLTPVNQAGIGTFSSTCDFEVEGNLLSLMYRDDFKDKEPLSTDNDYFAKLFYQNTKLKNAKDLIIKGATLPIRYCYNMFKGCTSLIAAPELSATTVNAECCNGMFSGCTSLSTVQNTLPATTLGTSCYKDMFNGCVSLTVIPSLPATTLAKYCYQYMFMNCVSLTAATELPSASMEDMCYSSMFKGCTSLATAPTLSSTTLANSCYGSMFMDCTSLTVAPELPATTLKTGCYADMFYGCTSLTACPSLSATTAETECYKQMFKGCTSLTAATDLPATTLSARCYREMFNGCTSLTTAPELSATTLVNDCYNGMFSNCRNLVTVPSTLHAITLAQNCCWGMFKGCLSLTAAPELPATTLANSCYREMFMDCTKLNYIKCLATDISATECTRQWTQSVANSGTFVKSSSMNDWSTGVSGIPTNWVVYDDTYVSVTGVSLNAQTTTVDKGSAYTLTATVLPSDAVNKNVTWSTSDSSIATVVNGIVTGTGCGDAIITVTTEEGGHTAQCVVSVENHVTGVDIDAYMLYLGSGGTYQFTETISPSDACNKSVAWTSSDSSIASIDTNGVVSGVSVGDATITVTTVDGGFSKNCAVTVIEPQHVTGVTLSDASISINTDSTYTLAATVMPVDAVNKNVTWSSSDNAIATVDSNGVVSGAASGSATITVTTVDGGYTASCEVTVSVAHDYSQDYFTIESLADNNTIMMKKGSINANISYSVDNGNTWINLTLSTSTTNLATINNGDKIIIKGVNSRLATAYNNYDRFDASGNFKVYGNAMSLLWGDNFESNSEFSANTTFNLCGLFYGTTTIIDASDLILPASSCTDSCYNGMFRGCTNLTAGPQLPATQSAHDCYSSMFEGCINLEDAGVPEINLVNMSQTCCQRMFCMDRSSKITTPKMTKSPKLRCASGADNCYKEMFKGNGNLVEVTCLKTDNTDSCSNWLSNCSSTGTFIKSPLKNNWPSSASGIPSGWTVEDYTE